MTGPEAGGNSALQRTSCLKKRLQIPAEAEKSGVLAPWFGLACRAPGAADCAPLRRLERRLRAGRAR
jgi:hypothetical protein